MKALLPNFLSGDFGTAKRAERKIEDDRNTTTDAETPSSTKFRTRLQKANLRSQHTGGPHLVAVSPKSTSSDESQRSSIQYSPLPSNSDDDELMRSLNGKQISKI